MTHASLKLHEPVGDEVKTTTCYMCACRCGIKVHLKDGKVRYIQGNPDHPVNRGVICAKGSAGIMQHYSPARLSKPLLRVGERGKGEFKEIEWDEALALATQWLGDIRRRNPDELAFFTGRDQSQALTGWWAQQFGTINYAAHGGFCSVNMAAAGMYTFGGSFWEFGEPDWEHTRYLMMFGVAEDHDSNPIKLGLGKLKQRGAKLLAINPVRTGYAAIADEWLGIRPGTDGLFVGALIQELLRNDWVDFDYLVRYTNAHYLVMRNTGGADDGLIRARRRRQAAVPDARRSDRAGRCDRHRAGHRRRLHATGRTPRRARVPALRRTLSRPRVFARACRRTVRHRRGDDTAHRQGDRRRGLPRGNPPAGSLDRRLGPHPRRNDRPADIAARDARHLGAQQWFPHLPDAAFAANDTRRDRHARQLPLPAAVPQGRAAGESPRQGAQARRHAGRRPPGLCACAGRSACRCGQGNPRRIDKAFSWQHPLAVHGMLQSVIANAVAGDPQRIDTLFLFMANMSWNSAMNTTGTRRMLVEKDADGAYKIPRIIYVDAYASEMVEFADLVLPDTTYLERYDCISLLDRPISDADAASDAIRHPVVAPDRDVRPFQDVLLDLGTRLGLPGCLREDGSARYPGGFAQYMVEHERAPGVGLLAGWRGRDGLREGTGEPNPQQLERYKEHGAFWHAAVPVAGRYYKMANRDYLEWARGLGFVGSTHAQVIELYSERLQRFRLAAQGHGAVQPPERERGRVARYFDPLPFWYAPFEWEQTDLDRYPIAAITQRPMFMYHSWGSQNAWLRQITARNFLYIHPQTAQALGLRDDDWAWVESPHGRIRVPVRCHNGTEPGTVWSWNAIGKKRGAWKLAANAPESQQGFLLNHVITELLPPREDGYRYANADPVTGQAAWFDLRVRIEKATDDVESPPHRIEVART